MTARATAIPLLYATLLASVVGCGEPPLPVTPLPPLVQPTAAKPAPLVRPLLFHPHERITLDIRWRGMSAGQVHLIVDNKAPPGANTVTVRSEFRTKGIAATVVRVSHKLRSIVDLGEHRPIESSEILIEGRETEQTDVVFRGSSYQVHQRSSAHTLPDRDIAHSMHSALGALRAWAGPNATSGYLYVLHGRKLHRLSVAAPIHEPAHGSRPASLRIECEAVRVNRQLKRTRAAPTAITLWLSDDERRAPLRIELERDGDKILAELIDYRSNDT